MNFLPCCRRRRPRRLRPDARRRRRAQHFGRYRVGHGRDGDAQPGAVRSSRRRHCRLRRLPRIGNVTRAPSRPAVAEGDLHRHHRRSGADVVVQPGTSEAPGSFRTVVGGLHTTPALIAHQGFQHGVQLDVSPLASRALLGMPTGALPTGAVELDDVVGRVGSELWERFAEAPTWEARFAVLDAELSARAVAGGDGRHGRVAPELVWAWERLASLRWHDHRQPGGRRHRLESPPPVGHVPVRESRASPRRWPLG